MKLSSVLATTLLLGGAIAAPTHGRLYAHLSKPSAALSEPSIKLTASDNSTSPVNSYDYLKGGVQNPEPAPYTPAGGTGTDPKDIPFYHPLSDFDWESLNLALHQEYIELDLFRYALKRFSPAEFAAAGIDDAGRYLIEFMSDQEVGHARLITNILGPNASKECKYQDYPFDDVKGFIDFSQKLTKWGEAGVYGFLSHLDSRAAATLLTQSITTEARQQMIFRQFEGLFPMSEWFEPGIPQSWAWTLLAPWITSCPQDNQKLAWQNFPALNITNNPDPQNPYVAPAIAPLHSQGLSYPGRKVELRWEQPGKTVGPDGKYTTSVQSTGTPKFVAWVSQLNTTYTPIEGISADGLGGYTIQPGGTVFPPEGGLVNGTAFDPVADPVVNSTMFIAVTDDNPYVTPFNLSLINKHVLAGPAVYAAG
ncbi:hypothetical protein HKX48_004764 [Thoreauomyces humboldtii]|nr:hypothetical protein HKX48_004764 [Thoreauomyces humboldtii]